MKELIIGRVVNTFGIRGEVKVIADTDFPEERFAPGSALFLRTGNQRHAVTVASAREHKGMFLIRFDGYDNINEVEFMKGALLAVDQDSLPPLPEGSYYFFQLKGLQALDPQGQQLGTVVRMESSAAHNLIRLRKPDGTEALVPYVEAFVEAVDLQRGTITLKPIEGLL